VDDNKNMLRFENGSSKGWFSQRVLQHSAIRFGLSQANIAYGGSTLVHHYRLAQEVCFSVKDE
jgi:hypothetical protein